jgi:methylmalonyl-CoA/ethylmalonyl-CoA epimerase
MGMVVRDARKTAREYEKFGVGPFVEEDFPSVDAKVYGKPAIFKNRTLIANIGGWELELVQVLEGEQIFSEFLEKRGEGVHHLGLYVEDYDAEMAKWKELGVRVLMESKCPPPYPEGSRYAYLDTEAMFGIILEIAWPTTISLK